MTTKYMTEFQKEKLEIMRELSGLKSQIGWHDKCIQLLYDRVTELQERIFDLKEKEYKNE